MSQENVEVVRRSLGGSMRGRAASLVAALVALACLLCVGVPVRAAAATPFRLLIVRGDAQLLRSDGVRFVTLQRDSSSAPTWVFDTLAGRRFRPPRPSPDCRTVVDVGGGFALWRCVDRYMLTDFATGAAREPVGWAAVEAMDGMEGPDYQCYAWRIGRYWLQGSCDGPGGTYDPFFLNHRTGRLITQPAGGWEPFDRFNVDYAGLVTPRCAPVRRGWLHISQPPFTLQALFWRSTVGGLGLGNGVIRLWRCGEQRADTVSRCPANPNDCAAVQLGSRYVTWAEGNRVFAYLPRARRRVLVAPAPAGIIGEERPVDVVHTCDRVFAQWTDALYVARFEPRRAAPLCQTRSRRDTARASNTRGERKAPFLEAAGLRE
jgi:hypothetical protein